MPISPRSDEVEAVVTLLESGDFETSAELAKAVIRKLAALFEERDGYGVGIGLPTDDVDIPYGPIYNIGDAKRIVNEARARGLRAFIAPLLGPSRALKEEDEVLDRRCTCGHPRQLHGIAMTTFTGKPKPAPSIGCAVFHRWTKEQCPCKGYERG